MSAGRESTATGAREAAPLLEVSSLSKTFTLHTQGGVRLPVLENLDLVVAGGECVVLAGPSGSGKSTLLRSLYGNYKPSAGSIRVRHDGGWVELAGADPRTVLAVRERTMGYVSQFLRVIPRIAAVDVVAERARAGASDAHEARAHAEAMLERVRLPRRLWELPPATFSGGEQQRVNIARCFVRAYPVLLLDEPTASLDARNRDVVIDLVAQARARGSAIVGIFHDAAVRDAVATRVLDVTRFQAAA